MNKKSIEIPKMKPFDKSDVLKLEKLNDKLNNSTNKLTHFYFGCSTNLSKPIIHKRTIKTNV